MNSRIYPAVATYLKRFRCFILVIKHLNQLIFWKRRTVVNLLGPRVLTIIHNYFSINQLTYWVDFGTLLGVVREANFLRKDEDIDLGFQYSQQKEIWAAFRKLGFKRKYYYRFNDQITSERYYFLHLAIDVHYYFEINEKKILYLLVEQGSSGECQVYEYTFTSHWKVKEVLFKHQLINVPENFKEVLIENYGPDWSKPTSDWEIGMSPAAKLLTTSGMIVK